MKVSMAKGQNMRASRVSMSLSVRSPLLSLRACASNKHMRQTVCTHELATHC